MNGLNESVLASPFLNNIQCKLLIKDSIGEIANRLLIEVVHRLKKPVTSFDAALTIMVDAAEHCADIESTKAEMLNALWREYGLTEQTDPLFTHAQENCLSARYPTAPEPPILSLDEFQCLIKETEELTNKVKTLAEKFVQYRTSLRKRKNNP